jgi:hypothetical protein
MTETQETQETVETLMTQDSHPTTVMIPIATVDTGQVLRGMLMTAFQLIRPSRISNSVMSSAMTRLSKTDTARLKITESLTSVMLEPDPTKDQTPSDTQTPTPVDVE